jgi:hypothetical protein
MAVSTLRFRKSRFFLGSLRRSVCALWRCSRSASVSSSEGARVGGLSEGGNFTSEDVDFGLRAMITPASLPGSYRATPRPQQGSDCEQVAPWRGRASRGGTGMRRAAVPARAKHYMAVSSENSIGGAPRTEQSGHSSRRSN